MDKDIKANASIYTPLVLLIFLQGLFFYYRSYLIEVADESLHIYSAFLVFNKKFPYKDFFCYLTPGTYITGAVLFFVAGVKLFYLKLLLFIMAIISNFALFEVLKRDAKTDLHILVIFLSFIGIYTFLSYTFSHHTFINFLFIILYYAVIVYYADKRLFYLSIGGIIGILSFFNQAHGFYHYLAIFLFIILDYKKGTTFKRLFYFTLPSIVIYAVFASILFYHGAFKNFLDDAVFWVLNTYAKSLSFGLFADTTFYIRNMQGFFIENFIFLIVKTAVLILLTLEGVKLFSYDNPRRKISYLLILSLFLANIQTFQNLFALYLLFFILLHYYLFSGIEKGYIIILFLVLFFIQDIRFVLAKPVRNYIVNGSIYAAGDELIAIGNEGFIGRRDKDDFTNNLKGVADYLNSRNIKKGFIISNSEFQIYRLSKMENPSIHTIIFPLYLNNEKLGEVAALMDDPENYIVYDKSVEKIYGSNEFFSAYQYKNRYSYEEFRNFGIFKKMRGLSEVYKNNDFIVYHKEP